MCGKYLVYDVQRSTLNISSKKLMFLNIYIGHIFVILKKMRLVLALQSI